MFTFRGGKRVDSLWSWSGTTVAITLSIVTVIVFISSIAAVVSSAVVRMPSSRAPVVLNSGYLGDSRGYLGYIRGET